MEEISISKFKATCLAVLENVRRTRRRVRVTRFGTPVAEIIPPSADQKPASWIGGLEGTGRLRDDLIAPAAQPDDWSALRR